MILQSEKIQLKKMISDSISVLCRAGLPFHSKFQVEAVIGITLDDNEVVLVSFKETTSSNGLSLFSELDQRDEEGDIEDDSVRENTPPREGCNEEENLECDRSSNYQDQSGNQYLDEKQIFRRHHGTGDQNQGSVNSACTSSRISCGPMKSTRVGKQSGGSNHEQVGSNFTETYWNENNCADGDSKFYPLQLKSEVTYGDTDDCMIVKSEQPECFDGDEQPWPESEDTFQKIGYVDFPGGEMPVDNMSYAQDSSWTSKFSQMRDRKPKLTSLQKRKIKPMHGGYAKPKFPKPAAKQPMIQNSSEATESTIGRAVMQCAYCSAVFNKSHVLKEHVNGVHFKKKLFHCPDCGESFKWRAELSRHRRMPGLCPCTGIAAQDWHGMA